MSITNPLSLLGLTLLGCLAPLLSALALWQLKEWRWDRLAEHLRRERWDRSLFGIVRPALFAAFGIGMALGGVSARPLVLTIILTAIAAVTVAQSALRRQPRPVWTQKACLLAVTSGMMDIVLSLLLLQTQHWLLPVLILGQWLVLGCSWAITWPLDAFLKHRTFERAKALRARVPNLTVIGVTGSVGKTTTKELLAHLLADLGALATPAHVNSEMGVAQWMLRTLRDGAAAPRLLVVEMGAYRRGEIQNLCAIVRPTLGVVTFIGSQHVALFGSEEALVLAKGELLQALPKEGRAFLNADCEPCRAMRTLCACPVTLAGTGGVSDIEAFDVEETRTGIQFRADGTLFGLPLHGTHNVTNALLAIAVGRHLGLRPEEIARKLCTFKPPHRTFEVREERGVTILDDTHNASPASFRAAIAWARTQPFERKVLLTPGIIELGEEQERTHRELGGMAADVFQEVFFLSPVCAQTFSQGYGKPVPLLSEHDVCIPRGTLLVCVGRMPPKTITRLLPPAV